MDAQQEVLKILDEILRLGSRLSGMSAASPLLGAVPEVDSMAVVAILTTLEERFGFIIEDDEMDGSVFATVGSLSSFVERKLDVLSSAAPLLP
ncbi:MAG TPA: acyl carrier protein [Rhodocyclaceae bacterium]|nr:acyl carrier protein [Rhodocyclaceae bacterium]HUY02661.1 acyl carrier protein [Rhodocyclaceae bacterium]